MIYKFLVRNEDNKEKLFYMTADSHAQLYRRIMETYRIPKDKVTLLAEYETLDISGKYKLHKEYIQTESVDMDIRNKAKDIFIKNRKCNEPFKSEYIEKYSFKEEPISCEADLIPLLSKYKKIKVYFETGEKRGDKKYYALCKN